MTGISLRGKTALITGIGSGIGREVALRLAQGGANLVLAGRGEDALLETQAGVNIAGADSLILSADVTCSEQIDHLVAQAVQTFGTIDILVNSAGVGSLKPLDQVTPDDIDRLLGVNVRGTILATQAALRPMIANARGGHIINIAGILGRVPMANASVYCASKYAVTGFSKALQLEVSRKHSIKVPLMYFGGVDSPFWDTLDMRVQRDKMLSVGDTTGAIVYALTVPSNLVLGEITLPPDSHQL